MYVKIKKRQYYFMIIEVYLEVSIVSLKRYV